MEFEKKILLTNEEYLILQKHLYGENEGQQQTNYYYDTDDLSMNWQGITCRIREKDERFIATHKVHGTDHSIEKSTLVMGISDLFPLSRIPLELKGTLTTKRHKWYRQNGITVFLDENVYLGAVDYELEIEYPEDNEFLAYLEIQRFAELLYGYGLIHSTAEIVGRLIKAKSKSQRFFDRYQKLRGWVGIEVGDQA